MAALAFAVTVSFWASAFSFTSSFFAVALAFVRATFFFACFLTSVLSESSATVSPSSSRVASISASI